MKYRRAISIFLVVALLAPNFAVAGGSTQPGTGAVKDALIPSPPSASDESDIQPFLRESPPPFSLSNTRFQDYVASGNGGDPIITAWLNEATPAYARGFSTLSTAEKKGLDALREAEAISTALEGEQAPRDLPKPLDEQLAQAKVQEYLGVLGLSALTRLEGPPLSAGTDSKTVEEMTKEVERLKSEFAAAWDRLDELLRQQKGGGFFRKPGGPTDEQIENAKTALEDAADRYTEAFRGLAEEWERAPAQPAEGGVAEEFEEDNALRYRGSVSAPEEGPKRNIEDLGGDVRSTFSASAGTDGSLSTVLSEDAPRLRAALDTLRGEAYELEISFEKKFNAIKSASLDKYELTQYAEEIGDIAGYARELSGQARAAASLAENIFLAVWDDDTSTVEDIAVAYLDLEKAKKEVDDLDKLWTTSAQSIGSIAAAGEPFNGFLPQPLAGGPAQPYQSAYTQSLEGAKDALNADKVFLEAKCNSTCHAEVQLTTLTGVGSTVSSSNKLGFAQSVIKSVFDFFGGEGTYDNNKGIARVFEYVARTAAFAYTLGSSEIISNVLSGLSIGADIIADLSDSERVGLIKGLIKFFGGDNVYDENKVTALIAHYGAQAILLALTASSPTDALPALKLLSDAGADFSGNQKMGDYLSKLLFSAAARGEAVQTYAIVFVPNDEPARTEIDPNTTFEFDPMDFEIGPREEPSVAGGSGSVGRVGRGGSLAAVAVASAAVSDPTAPAQISEALDSNPRSQVLQCLNICAGQGITTKPENSYFVGPQTCSSAPYGSCNNVVYYTSWLCNPGFIEDPNKDDECVPLIRDLESSDIKPPEATLAASPSPLLSGNRSTLSWTIANASSCEAGGGWSGTKSGPSGSEVIPDIAATTVFTLSCSNPAGAVTVTTTVAVTRADEDFALTSVGRLSVRAVTGERATSTAVTVKVMPMNGFVDPVSLSATLSPALEGFDYAFGDGTLSEDEYDRGSSLQVYFPTGEIESGYTVTVTGVSGPLTRTINLPLSVTPIQPKFEEF